MMRIMGMVMALQMTITTNTMVEAIAMTTYEIRIIAVMIITAITTMLMEMMLDILI